jgi:prepilin-type processing-associated H-X9-DG protein
MGYDTSGVKHFLLDTSNANMMFFPGYTESNTAYIPPPGQTKGDDPPQARWGIFGQVNLATTFAMIRDGTTNTIMTGELQRINVIPASITGATQYCLSHDGWAVGGDATGFSTGLPAPSMMNNQMFQSPGSDHPGGANFGLADGSVTFLTNSVDQNLFALLGSMADGVPVQIPN